MNILIIFRYIFNVIIINLGTIITMPLTTPSQYLKTVDEFVAHWGQVNTHLAPGQISLRGYALSNLQANRATLAALMTAVQLADNVSQTASADRDIRKTDLKERLRQFRAMVAGQLADTSAASVLPKIPPFSAAPGTWIAAFDNVAGLWQDVNTAPPVGFAAPLTLSGGYGLASFSSETSALKNVFTAVTNAERGATMKRRERDALATAIKIRLREYRKSVAGAFVSGQALLETLPKL